jgi:hypothetical protein
VGFRVRTSVTQRPPNRSGHEDFQVHPVFPNANQKGPTFANAKGTTAECMGKLYPELYKIPK